MLSTEAVVRRAGLDGIALKPREVDLSSVTRLPADRVTVDFEGPDAIPSTAVLRQLADLAELRVTVPVRADGFDPLGDDRGWADLPAGVDLALVAGNPAYLRPAERRRSIAPRLASALDRAPDAWVGTEGIERLALATGATQFELLGPDTERQVSALRTAGFDGGIAVYAPVVLSTDPDARLDALGPYVARRQPIASALPRGTPVDATATGSARNVLLEACEGYAMVGSVEAVRDRVDGLRAAGVDHVVGYPARGLAAFHRDD